MKKCDHGRQYAGTHVSSDACQDPPTSGSAYCEIHRAAALERVNRVRKDDNAALRSALKWPGLVWDAGRTW